MTIQEFLLARLADDEATAGMQIRDSSTSYAFTPPGHFDEMRAIIDRHRDRTMTVSTWGMTETVTRCGICPKNAPQPCTALRILAQDYRHHPDYRDAWDVLEAEGGRHHHGPTDTPLGDDQPITIVPPEEGW